MEWPIAVDACFDGEEHYRLFAEATPDGILTIDEHGRITFANPALERILGYAPAELVGTHLTRLMPERLRSSHREGMESYLRTGDRRLPSHAVELPGLHKDGREVPLEISFAQLHKDGRRHFTGVLRDVSLRKRAEEERDQARLALRRSETRFRALIENSSDAIALLDREGNILYASPSTRAVLGYSEGDFVGRNAYSLIHPDDLEDTRKVLDRLRGNPGRSVTAEYRVLHRDGDWRWVEGVATNLLHEPGVDAVVNNYRDITERQLREKSIRHQAQHDPLTDLPNRMLFRDRLDQSLARANRSGRCTGVGFCDLDHFRRINEDLGHAGGDRLLRAVAQRLKACLREEDTVGRMGGDEFTVILQDMAKPEDAAIVARKILAAVARPVDIGGHQVTVTASLGISIYPRDGEAPEALLKRADDALYRAKALGRNTYQVSD